MSTHKTINPREKFTNPVCDRCHVKDPHRGGRTWRNIYLCYRCHSIALTVDAQKCNECGDFHNTSLEPCGHWLCEKHAPLTAFNTMMRYIGLTDRDTHNSRRHKKDPCQKCDAFECCSTCHNCHRNRVCECYKCCKQVCEWCYTIHKKRGINCPSCGDMQCAESLEKCSACDKPVCLKCYSPDKCNGASVCRECYSESTVCEDHTNRSGDRVTRKKDHNLCQECARLVSKVRRHVWKCSGADCRYNVSRKMCDTCQQNKTEICKLTLNTEDGLFYCSKCLDDNFDQTYIYI
jgi:hypothetical protein